MTWSGYVTGSATLYIQGNRADIQGRDTGAIDRPHAQFFAPLPAGRSRVDMQIRRGRGRVEIVEQPTPDNEFSAVVQLNPPGRQPEFYTLDFYWERGRNQETSRSRTVNPGSGEFRWSGEVDREVLVEVRGRRASSRIVNGQSVIGEHFDVSGEMPRQAVNVRLEDVSGRGRIEVVDQPTAQNGYAAVVRVRDEGSGRAPYSFRLLWDATGQASSGDSVLSPSQTDGRYRTPVPDQGFARWVGRVDGRVRVTIQGNRATSTTVTGKPVSGMNVDFGGGPGIPSRNVSDVQVRKISGRGELRVIQTPDTGNSALVFDIDDNSGGADYYEVEITWR